jgi:hypothetical protein
MRNSNMKITGCGNPRSLDWSRQSVETRANKKPRRKCFKEQVYMGQLIPVHGVTVNKVEMITLRKDGKPVGQQAVGYMGKQKVVRDGYGYSFTKHGRTPGLWYPAS